MRVAYTKALIARLESMSIEDLKKKWRDVHESEPPKFNRQYLESRLAYRLQELSFCALRAESLERIRELHQEFTKSKSRFKPRRRNSKHLPPIGTILARHFRGQEYQARVVEDGFEYNGRVYKTLTGIARAIGAHWSGPVFFGLASHD